MWKSRIISFLKTLLIGTAKLLFWLFVFAEALWLTLYLGLPQKYSYEQSYLRQPQLVVEAQLNLRGLDWLPPQVSLNKESEQLKYLRSAYVLTTDEPVTIANLPEGWALDLFDQNDDVYRYVLQTNNIPDGDYLYELQVTDADGNVNVTTLHLYAPGGRADTPSWPNTKYFIDGDNLLAVVNKKYSLFPDYAPSDLVTMTSYGIPNYNYSELRREAADALKEMTGGLTAAGISYVVTSAYRSFETQVGLYRYWVDYYHGDAAAASMISARPGYSEHQLGTTIDFLGQDGTLFIAGTALDIWLRANAHKYGFVMSYPYDKTEITGYNGEPWHYRYIGRENAQAVHDSGLTLTEWLYQHWGYTL